VDSPAVTLLARLGSRWCICTFRMAAIYPGISPIPIIRTGTAPSLGPEPNGGLSRRNRPGGWAYPVGSLPDRRSNLSPAGRAFDENRRNEHGKQRRDTCSVSGPAHHGIFGALPARSDNSSTGTASADKTAVAECPAQQGCRKA